MGTYKYETSIDFKYYWESLNNIESYVSFMNQIKTIYELKPQNVLEIGVGNKLTYNHLKQIGIEVTSVDINPKLEPDITEDIRYLSLKNNTYDVVSAFEVLEHLPFSELESALIELKRVTKKYIVLSLPIQKLGIEISMWLPIIHNIYYYIDLPYALKHKGVQTDNDYHYWEVNKKGYSKHKLLSIFKKHFKVVKEFRPKYNKHHWFVILEKGGNV